MELVGGVQVEEGEAGEAGEVRLITAGAVIDGGVHGPAELVSRQHSRTSTRFSMT